MINKMPIGGCRFNHPSLCVIAMTFILGACSSIGSILPTSYFSKPEPELEPATIAWLVPEDMLIAFSMSEGYNIKNRDAVLILNLGDKRPTQAKDTNNTRKHKAVTESFKLIKMPPRELKNLGEAARAKGTAYFRFDTDDYNRAQALVDKTRAAKAQGDTVQDSFGLAPIFCRETTTANPIVFSASILFSREPDANNLPKTRSIVTNRKLEDKTFERC